MLLRSTILVLAIVGIIKSENLVGTLASPVRGEHFAVSQNGKWALIGNEVDTNSRFVLLNLQNSDTTKINIQFDLGLSGWAFGFCKNDSIAWYQKDAHLYFIDISSITYKNTSLVKRQFELNTIIFNSALKIFVKDRSYVKVELIDLDGRLIMPVLSSTSYMPGYYDVPMSLKLPKGFYIFKATGAQILSSNTVINIK